jgi:hypothetical protein
MRNYLLVEAIPFYLVYEGEGEGGGDPPPTPPPTPAPVADDDKPTLSQKKVNAILAEEKRKNKEIIDRQVKELETLKKSRGLTEQEKTGLTARIEELQNTLLTKEELAVKERKKLEHEHKVALEQTTTERDTWKNKFVQSTIVRSITDEAVRAEAFAPNQIVALLEKNTRLAEVVDADGNPTGEFIPKVKMQDVDKDGKPLTLDLTVSEALKRMKDRADEYGNLFKSGVAGGLGAAGGKSGKDVDPSKMSPEQYRLWRNGRLGRKGK